MNAVVLLQNVAIDTELEGVVPIGCVGHVGYGVECTFSPTVSGLGSTAHDDLIATFPVENGEHSLMKVEKVEGAGYPTLLIVDGPLGAIRREVIVLGELFKQLVCLVTAIG